MNCRFEAIHTQTHAHHARTLVSMLIVTEVGLQFKRERERAASGSWNVWKSATNLANSFFSSIELVGIVDGDGSSKRRLFTISLEKSLARISLLRKMPDLFAFLLILCEWQRKQQSAVVVWNARATTVMKRVCKCWRSYELMEQRVALCVWVRMR